jgi:lipoate-protein ligase A
MLGADVERRGTSDLATGARKFSGNSVRCKRNTLLYHGTLLYNFPLPLITGCLAQAPRQPEYRQGRSHDAFVANLPLEGGQIRRALIEAWRADQEYGELPHERIRQLVAEKYSQDSWNYRL